MIRGYYQTYWERIHGQDHMPQIVPLLGNAKLNCNYALSSKKNVMIKTRKSHQYFLQIYTFILSSKGLMFSKNDGISIFLNICTSTHFVLNIIIFKILQNSLQWLE